jgi:hypothetical protein
VLDQMRSTSWEHPVPLVHIRSSSGWVHRRAPARLQIACAPRQVVACTQRRLSYETLPRVPTSMLLAIPVGCSVTWAAGVHTLDDAQTLWKPVVAWHATWREKDVEICVSEQQRNSCIAETRSHDLSARFVLGFMLPSLPLCTHAYAGAHGKHTPPQSTPVSFWFCIAS